MAARLRKLSPAELTRLSRPKVITQTVEGTPGPQGPQGPMGPAGPAGVTKIIREVIEKPAQDFSEEIQALRKSISDLKKRRPENTFVGGSNPTAYIPVTEQVTHLRKPSFVNGITVIGVRYNGAATVYLPHDLDPTMLVSVKDEVGGGNITILVE